MQLERIKQLLVETDLSVEAIAARTGFAYPAYLSVAFKKHTGQTPKEFRNAARPTSRPAKTKTRDKVRSW